MVFSLNYIFRRCWLRRGRPLKNVSFFWGGALPVDALCLVQEVADDGNASLLQREFDAHFRGILCNLQIIG